jgi:hypothetical protein
VVVGLGSEVQKRVMVRTVEVGMSGTPVGFYVPDAFALPMAGATVTAEAAPTQIMTEARPQMPMVYGLGGVAGQLVANEQIPGQGLPFISFGCYATMGAMAVQYRLTVKHPV